MKTIPVYENNQIISRVRYNENLDTQHNGGDYYFEKPWIHRGITKLRKTGKYVLIHGSCMQGQDNWAEVITEKEAVAEIIKSGDMELFDDPRFTELRTVMESEFDSELVV